MKASITVIFFWILSAAAFSQSNKLGIGISLAPAFYSMKPQSGSGFQYTSKINYRIGIDLSLGLSKKSAIATGLYYSALKYKLVYNYFLQQAGDPNVPLNSQVSAGYLDIPFTYNYNFLSKQKLIVYLSPSIISSIVLSHTSKTVFADNSVRNSGELNSFLFSIQLGVGLKYKLTENAAIKIEPQYRLFLKGFDNSMKQNPSAINAVVGIVYNLKKKIK